jgi:hypothetical protein
MNGVDAVVLATVMISVLLKPEYTPMPLEMENTRVFSHAKIENGTFTFGWKSFSIRNCWWLTSLHPLVKLSLEMLKPSAKELMQFVAVAD